MKRCPQCNRTYDDDTQSFCLDDGCILSATYNEEETVTFSKDYQVGQTDPNFHPDKSVVTVIAKSPNTSPSQVIDAPSGNSSISPHLIYAVAGLIGVLAIVSGLVWVNSTRTPPTEVSSATNARKETNSTSPNRNVAAPAPPPVENALLASGTVPVNSPFTNVGTFSGRILIEMGGKASADHTMPDVGPEGVVNHNAPNNNWALPGASLYCAIANVNGRVMYVGRRLELTLNSPTAISLGPNDEPGLQGAGFKDNVGSWSYKITQLSGNAPSTTSGWNNVPTTRQLQDELLREAKRIEDAANR